MTKFDFTQPIYKGQPTQEELDFQDPVLANNVSKAKARAVRNHQRLVEKEMRAKVKDVGGPDPHGSISDSANATAEQWAYEVLRSALVLLRMMDDMPTVLGMRKVLPLRTMFQGKSYPFDVAEVETVAMISMTVREQTFHAHLHDHEEVLSMIATGLLLEGEEVDTHPCEAG